MASNSETKIDDWQEIGDEAPDPGDRQEVGEDAPLPPTVVETAYRKGVDGLAQGYLDEIGGHFEAIGSKFGVRGLGSSSLFDKRWESPEEDKQGYWDVYRQERDRRRGVSKVHDEANPKTAKIAEVVGATLPYLGAGGTTAGASIMRAAGRGALAGGAGAGIYAAGDSDTDLTTLDPNQYKDFAQEVGGATLLGAGTGGLFSGAFGAANKYLGKTSEELAEEATEEAAQQFARNATEDTGQNVIGNTVTKSLDDVADDALEPTLREVVEAAPDRQTVGKGAREFIEGKKNQLADYLNDLAEKRAFKASTGQNKKAFREAAQRGELNARGRELLDDGVVGFGDSVTEIAEKAATKKKEVGQALGEFRKALDEMIGKPAISAEAIKKRLYDIADSVDDEASYDVAEALRKQADRFIDDMTITRAEALRRKFDPPKTLGDQLRSKLPEQAREEVRQTLRNQVDDVVETVGENTEGFDINSYRNLKNKYMRMSEAAKTAEDRALGDLSNRFVSPSDHAAAGMAFLKEKGTNTALDLALGFGAGAVNKYIRSRGSSMAAVGADKLSKVLRQNPTRFGKYAEQLLNAAERGPEALGASHFIMWKNEPEYRQMWDANAAEMLDQM